MSHLLADGSLGLKRLTLVLLVILGLTCIAFLLEITAQKANAQTPTTTMSQLLNQLAEEKRQITFRFVVPLVANENIWVIPNENTDENSDISINIGEIGDDYICFNELAGQAYTMQCTPFSNIAGISYLNQPK